MPKRGEAWTVYWFKGGLGKKEGDDVFEWGVVIPQSTLCCFTHEAVYFDREDSAKRTISGKILKDGVYEIVINSKMDNNKD